MDEYLRNEMDVVNKAISQANEAKPEPVREPTPAEISGQQSLPLDGPDLNDDTTPMPSAVVETVRSTNANESV